MRFPVGTIFRIEVRSPNWASEEDAEISHKHYKIGDITKDPDKVESFYVFIKFNKDHEFIGRNEYISESIHSWADENDDVETFLPHEDRSDIPVNIREY